MVASFEGTNWVLADDPQPGVQDGSKGATYHNPSDSSDTGFREAQKWLWDSGIALEGPDSDALTGDNRDNNGLGVHFSAKGLQAQGKLWAQKVGVYLDRILTGKEE